MKNKRRINRHIKKYNCVKILSAIVYTICGIVFGAYWIYYFIWYMLFDPIRLPYIEWYYGCGTLIIFPIVCAMCIYKGICADRAMNIIRSGKLKKKK